MKIDIQNNSVSVRLEAICRSEVLLVGGLGVRFQIQDANKGIWPAFAVRHSKGISSYLNRCAHLALELDWEPGNLFDLDGEAIICSTHGALYDPASGECVSGPCNGRGLESLFLKEDEGVVYLADRTYSLYSSKEDGNDT